MTQKILIDAYHPVIRAALIDEGKLLDYYEEVPDRAQEKGNIYRAQVKRIEPNIQAAFVEYGGRKDAFLPIKEVGPLTDLNGEEVSDLRPGDILPVQVVKDGVGQKGASVTTRLSLAGRYLIFLPHQTGGGISSRIRDARDRNQLKKFHRGLRIPEGSSVILRTAAAGLESDVLQNDLEHLMDSHALVMDEFTRRADLGILYRDGDLVLRYLREYYRESVSEIHVNTPDSQERCLWFFGKYGPEAAKKVRMSPHGATLFAAHGLEEQIQRLQSRRITLASGASLVLEQTEALVSIDVNSARSKSGETPEETILETNIEAAKEVARQLRLRDLGGIIVVDFIDMAKASHRRQVEEAIRREIEGDKAKSRIYPIGPLGVMLLNRQRVRRAPDHVFRQSCESCSGRGWNRAPRMAAVDVLRKMEERLKKNAQGAVLVVRIAPQVIFFLANDFRDQLDYLEEKYTVRIRMEPLPGEDPGAMELGLQPVDVSKPSKDKIPAVSGRVVHCIESTAASVRGEQTPEEQSSNKAKSRSRHSPEKVRAVSATDKTVPPGSQKPRKQRLARSPGKLESESEPESGTSATQDSGRATVANEIATGALAPPKGRSRRRGSKPGGKVSGQVRSRE